MTDDSIARIAAQVSLLMQLDRMRHHVGTEVDMQALANVPAYVARVFEQANAVGSDLSPNDAYDLVNKRISEVQAQLYLIRLELENRHARDPNKIYADPMAISAYGAELNLPRIQARSFDFGPEILAHGWYPMEIAEGRAYRWMRPGDKSLACVPHLGVVNQTLEIHGHALDRSQLDGLSISVGGNEAQIKHTPEMGNTHFVAAFEIEADSIRSASHVAVEFTLQDFQQPNDQDTRLLGINIQGFVCAPATERASAEQRTAETAGAA